MSKRLQCKKKLIASFIATTLASTAGVPSTSWAQTAEASLRGRAPANSEVTARNTETGLTRHTKTDADGTYTLVGLPPGTYHVDAGPGTEATIELTVASTTTLDLEPGAGQAAPEAAAETQRVWLRDGSRSGPSRLATLWDRPKSRRRSGEHPVSMAMTSNEKKLSDRRRERA